MGQSFLNRFRAFGAAAALNILVMSVTLTAVLFVSESVLALLNKPSVHANPPNYHELRKNIEFQFDLKMNSLGLRYKEIPLQEPAGTERIYVAGDSYVEGVGVAQDETFSAILERTMSRPGQTVNFIDGGFEGTGPKEYGDVFLSFGLRYHPQGLLICLYANDLSNTEPEFSNPALRCLRHVFPRLTELVQKLKFHFIRPENKQGNDLVGSVTKEAMKRGIDVASIEAWKKRLPPDLVEASNKGLYTAAPLSYGLLNPAFWTDSLDIDSPTAEKKWQRMAEILSRLVSECRKRHIQAALVFEPSEFQYVPEYHLRDNPWIVAGVKTRREWLTGTSELERRLEAWAAREKVSYFDLTPSLREAEASGKQLIYLKDGHWNPEGHKLVAKLIGGWLKQSHLFTK